MPVQTQQETLPFQAEVKQLLYLVTHSLYSNKEIFLRELISNASDAADKLRFEALSDAALYENDPDLKIWIDVDKEKQTITVRDNGIGMNREEVIQNLGTIAKSGTREFLEKLTASQNKESHLIGQFGVGFYSSFVVADKVIVKTRRAGMQKDQGVYWESNGEGQFVIENITKERRGTEVILHLKKDEEDFLHDWQLRQIITKYSDHILLPIIMKEPEYGEQKEGEPAPLVESTVNKATALWTLPKSKITDEEYIELYKHIAHDFEAPLLWSHNKVEGNLEYISLLYIPGRAPFDLFSRDQYKGVKLYARRVFIMDDAEQLLPTYLRFVRGIIDSNDLPLNVSREILQNNRVIESIRAACTKRVLDMLEKLAVDDPEKYKKFLKAFGSVIKEGPAEDFANRERIAKLFRFPSTKDDNAEATVSLDDYIQRMQPGQDKIYYVVADTFNAAKNSPHLEFFRKKGIEVLLLSEKIDEWWIAHVSEYADKKLQSVAKGDLGDLEVDQQHSEAAKEAEKQYQDVTQAIKDALAEKVKEVRVTHRLTDSPACLVTDENEMSAHLQRILQATGQPFSGSKPILEINPHHPLISQLKKAKSDEVKNWSDILFNQALLAEGGQLEDPGNFVKKINALLVKQVMG
jgi:molecular chaperone HtpG